MVAAVCGWSEPSLARVQVRLAESPPGGFVAGILASNLTVVIHHAATSAFAPAIVLRGVEWADYRADTRVWVGPRYGTTMRLPGGAIRHDTAAQSLTGTTFESGLLFPGEALRVQVPLTPQRAGRHELRVRYAEVGVASDWARHILLPCPSESPLATLYEPATADRVAARHGQGGDAIVTPPDRKAASAMEEAFSLQLPLADDPQNHRTGGLSAEAAALKAKLDAARDRFWAFYRPSLSAWFFVRPDGSAVAVRWEVPPTAPPGYFKWKVHELSKMDPTVPDDFRETTSMLLNPEVFQDGIRVSTPTNGMYYQPGRTVLQPLELWHVLLRAAERQVELRLATINPNGLGVETLVTAGVTVDAAGRWLSPKIGASETGGRK